MIRQIGSILGLTLAFVVYITVPASAAPPLADQATVVANLTNSAGDIVVLRRGFWEPGSPGSGFGFEKVSRKHGITNLGVLKFIVREPSEVRNEPPGSGTWVHETIARRFVCGARCTEVQRVTVRAVINYHGWLGPGQQGIVTVYCVNPDGAWACPDYVNTAFNAS